jgi:hypothetical protein
MRFHDCPSYGTAGTVHRVPAPFRQSRIGALEHVATPVTLDLGQFLFEQLPDLIVSGNNRSFLIDHNDGGFQAIKKNSKFNAHLEKNISPTVPADTVGDRILGMLL